MEINQEMRPRKRLPGLINMKYQAITFGSKYGSRDPQFMDRMAELMNLSDGTRTIAEITRIVGYEIGPIAPELVTDMFRDLVNQQFVIFD